MVRGLGERFAVTVFLVACMAVATAVPVSAAEGPPSRGGVLPPFALPLPERQEERGYLGLSGSGSFSIPEIEARLVIIEVYSMYCPHCQRDAHRVNRLFRIIEDREDLKGKVKLIGIAAGNTPFEVDFYRKEYGVPFPLFPDGDLAVHKALGEVRTPYFIAVKLESDGSHRVVYAELGGFKDAAEFLESMLELSGLK
jgi:peroxiredoxin